MKRQLLSLTCAFVVSGFLSTAAQAWNRHGHPVIALIAHEQMDADEREKVLDILRHHPHFQEGFLDEMPREIREDAQSVKDRWLFSPRQRTGRISFALGGEKTTAYIVRSGTISALSLNR